nr:nucleolar and coiled-body phosphoprotein 1-like [Aegilops tauschii subsp. strangulata]
MVRGPKPENANPSSMLWCREDNLFKRNYQFAKESAAKNKRDFGLSFNPGPSAPRQDGTRDANPNVIGPFTSFDGLLSHIAAQRATVEQSADDADSEDAPAPPKQKKKKSKALKPSATPKASTMKPLKTAPPEPSSISIDDLQLPVDISVTFHGAIANELALAQKIVELKNKIDHEKAHFKKHMAKLSVADVQIFKKMLHDLKEEFHKKREEAKGSRERMKYYAQKCVQAHNEAEKRKDLGRPGIDPRMAAKQKKKSAAAQTEAPRQEEPHIVFLASMTGSKPKVTSAASELKKTRAAEAEARKRKHNDTSDSAPSKKKLKTKSSKKDRAATPEPLIVEPISVALPASTNQEHRLVIHEPASTEAHASEEVPVADPTTAEDIGHEDNVDDVVLPQLQSQSVSSPALTSSELISIGRPLTPIAQDDSWAERQ